MKKPWTTLGACLVILSCAANPFPLRPFHPEVHASAAGEWSPHDHTVEWWYVTGALKDEADNSFFYQFTVFHGFRLNLFEGYVLHLAVTDVKNGKHWFFEDSGQPNETVFGREDRVAFKESDIAVSTSSDEITAMEVRGEAGKFSFAFHMRPRKKAVWHGRDGIVVMGHEDQAAERSYYYSFTDLETEGGLTLEGRTVAVRGSSWFDRQWGKFTETAWDWFSLRLTDGREIMLFSFPETGYNAGTLVERDGRAAPIRSFQLQRLKSVEYPAPDAVFSLGWRILLETGDEFRVLPLMADQYNPSQNTPPYWEGICSILSMKGELLGYCVTETTVGAQENPY
jgi:predicted secreted hydrolase